MLSHVCWNASCEQDCNHHLSSNYMKRLYAGVAHSHARIKQTTVETYLSSAMCCQSAITLGFLMCFYCDFVATFCEASLQQKCSLGFLHGGATSMCLFNISLKVC